MRMWLFIVLTLNALLGCQVLLTEAKLKEGECEGKFYIQPCSGRK